MRQELWTMPARGPIAGRILAWMHRAGVFLWKLLRRNKLVVYTVSRGAGESMVDAAAGRRACACKFANVRLFLFRPQCYVQRAEECEQSRSGAVGEWRARVRADHYRCRNPWPVGDRRCSLLSLLSLGRVGIRLGRARRAGEQFSETRPNSTAPSRGRCVEDSEATSDML
ncbi:hypothetical protein L226DRAFT_128037 [Lentinus tigrinus ALCF2SS1-7]|uniref:uncharacterized protein n=1 Tax=Lentinus tigrinus ALCF2SS1-7 TaxID=1328758 RepID=UPI00116638C4|nr:hypothetical protein L226DRAFT_128037 [Lentinus tigrinus ALCF2SS1-7]